MGALDDLAAKVAAWAATSGKWQGAGGAADALADAALPLLFLANKLGVDLDAAVAARLSAAPPGPTPPPGPAPGPRRRGLIVPAYFSPSSSGGLWDQLVAAAAKVPLVAIANPASGAGTSASAAYASAISRLAAAGGVPVGYVATSYGNRVAADVDAEVDRWRSFYPALRGIFFDEQAAGADKVPYYQARFAHARAVVSNAFVVSNPGGGCDQGYFAVAKPDVICLVEEPGSQPLTIPNWAAAAPDGYFAALVYAADRARMLAVTSSLAQVGLGWCFVTDDGLDGNPWNRLPAFWADEVAAVAAAPAIA